MVTLTGLPAIGDIIGWPFDPKISWSTALVLTASDPYLSEYHQSEFNVVVTMLHVNEGGSVVYDGQSWRNYVANGWRKML